MPFRAIVGREYRGRTALFAAVMILQVFGYYGFGAPAVPVLQHKGFAVVASLGYLASTYLGCPLGSLLAIPLLARVERKYLVPAIAGLMAAFGMTFGFALILISGGLYTLVSNILSDALHTYLPESFPTTASGVLTVEGEPRPCRCSTTTAPGRSARCSPRLSSA